MENLLPKVNIKDNKVFTQTHQVFNEQTAKMVGSGGLNVLATPIIVTWVEALCYEILERELPDNFSTVGSMFEIKHLKPTPIGDKVKIISKISNKDKNRINFSFEVTDGSNLVAKGNHQRVIINKKKFLENII